MNFRQWWLFQIINSEDPSGTTSERGIGLEGWLATNIIANATVLAVNLVFDKRGFRIIEIMTKSCFLCL
jgi:hypothetical protein